MKWSAPLSTGSIGILVTGDHVSPSFVVLMTMSFAEHPSRKRQSCQTAYTFPPRSTSAEGNVGERRPPATRWRGVGVTGATPLQVRPPSVERKACNAVVTTFGTATITVPSGWTRGWPPRPRSLPAVLAGVLQLSPPSVDV